MSNILLLFMSFVVVNLVACDNFTSENEISTHEVTSVKSKIRQLQNISLNELIDRSCDDYFTCLKIKIVSNLTDMVQSDEYTLNDWFTVERNEGSLKSSPYQEKERRYFIQEFRKRLKEGGAKLDDFLTSVIVRKLMNVFKSHSLRFNFYPGWDLRFFKRSGGDGKMDVALETVPKSKERRGRIFWGLGGIGARRRAVMVLLPIMFKLGILSTMVGVLTVLVVKSLAFTSILTIIVLGNLLKGHMSWKGHHEETGSSHSPGGHHHQPNVHVHVHPEDFKQGWHGGGVGGPTGWYERNEYDRNEFPYPYYYGREKEPVTYSGGYANS